MIDIAVVLGIVAVSFGIGWSSAVIAERVVRKRKPRVHKDRKNGNDTWCKAKFPLKEGEEISYRWFGVTCEHCLALKKPRNKPVVDGGGE